MHTHTSMVSARRFYFIGIKLLGQVYVTWRSSTSKLKDYSYAFLFVSKILEFNVNVLTKYVDPLFAFADRSSVHLI